jgi:hypothetical protein
MRHIPHSDGGRHSPYYSAASIVAEILSQNVHLSDNIPVAFEAALRTTVDPALGLVQGAALQAFLARPSLVLGLDLLPSVSITFVRKHMPCLARGSLVQPLVLNSPFVVVHPNVAQVADRHFAHASFVERVDRVRRQLMQEIRDLVVDSP